MAPRKAHGEIKGVESKGREAGKDGVHTIKAIFNNTLIRVTNMTTGRRTIARANGFWKVKDVAENNKNYGVSVLHIKIGGQLNFRCDTRCALHALARSSLVITNIEDVSPLALGA